MVLLAYVGKRLNRIQHTFQYSVYEKVSRTNEGMIMMLYLMLA